MDSIPAWLRHLAIATVSALLATALPMVQARSVDWADLAWTAAAIAITQLLLVLTPLTSQYGVSAAPAPAGQHAKP